MRQLAPLAAAIICMLAIFAVAAPGTEQPQLHVVRGGGAAGGDALYLPKGDVLNVRNIQGGMIGDANLDLGAGSTRHPGNLVLNYDVGRDVLIYDGRKRLVARLGRSGVVFYVKPRVRRPSARASLRP